jgi:DNA-binding MarR family transcriptional regulator
MLVAGGNQRRIAELAGFTETNAYPPMRSRRAKLTPALLAAVAALYRPGVGRRDLAQRLGYPESTVQTWIGRARSIGYLSPAPDRELTPEGQAAIAAAGLGPEAIVADWGRPASWAA